MKRKLITIFMLVGLLPLLTATIFSYVHGRRLMQNESQAATNALRKQAEEQLETVRDLKRERIEAYFQTMINQCRNIASYPFIEQAAKDLLQATVQYRAEHNLDDAAMEAQRIKLWQTYQNHFAPAYKQSTGEELPELKERFDKLDPIAIVLQDNYISANPNPLGAKYLLDTSNTTTHTCSYGRAHAAIHPAIRRFVESFKYADFMLIDAKSQRIIYSYAKEMDFGTSLLDGPFSDSNLSEAVQQVITNNKRDDYVYTRYKLYIPSLGTPAAFVVSGVFSGDDLTAVAAIQLSVDGINEVMHSRTGLGESGESYLVGPDFFLRSDAHLGIHTRSEEYTISNSFRKNLQIKTEPVLRALEGNTGVGITQSYHDPQTLRLSTWSPVEIAKGTRWALIAEIAEPEAMAIAKKINESGSTAINDLLKLNMTILIIAIVTIAVIATLVARRLGTPLLHAANNLQETVSHISSATTQLAAAGSETAASISETSATVEEIRQTAHVSTEKAKGVENAAQQTMQVSATGRNKVRETIESMHTIEQRMETIAESIVHLSEQCQAIGEIISAINDLADQSNLLAVNASIEAAKAGEEGRGFAVVAQEVRNLAEQSKQATTQVKSILRDIQKATAGAVMATEEGGKAVASGVQQSAEAGRTIEELSRSIEAAAQAAIQIAATSQQQLIGMDQMAYAMENINHATSQNVDSARQLEETAHRLDHLGRHLSALVTGERETNSSSQLARHAD